MGDILRVFPDSRPAAAPVRIKDTPSSALLSVFQDPPATLEARRSFQRPAHVSATSTQCNVAPPLTTNLAPLWWLVGASLLGGQVRITVSTALTLPALEESGPLGRSLSV
jgi:hypothetical protein